MLTQPTAIERAGHAEPLSEEMRSRLSVLVARLKYDRLALKYVGYRQAERDCEILAAQILNVYPRSELDSFAFAAIPRGGLIVLGMLAYILNLQRAQLHPDLFSTRPLFFIDDCAFTGGRFASWLATTKSPRIVFAHLYSHPDLRRAIVGKEARVETCLAAHDLDEHSEQCFSSQAEYQAWLERWQERLPDRYWIGMPDPVCFAWSEPDHPYWNPVSERLEGGWRLIPPHLCLKNKSQLGLPHQAVKSTDWRVCSHVASGRFENALWLCNTETGQVYSVSGLSADMWSGLSVYGNVEATCRYLLGVYDVDEAQLERDVCVFVKQLAERGLLERVAGSDGPGE